MKRQKGQSIIEFAIVLPLFVSMFLGIVYMGMFFADYLTLSYITRDSARLAAVGTTEQNIRSKYKDTKLITGLYSWSSNDTNAFVIGESTVEGDDCMTVTSAASCTTSGFRIFDTNISLPNPIMITYSMHKEK